MSEQVADSVTLPPETEAIGCGIGPTARLLFFIAVAFSAFQLWTAAYAPLPSQVIRAVHVGFLLLLLFGLVANRAPEKRARAALFWLLGVVEFLRRPLSLGLLFRSCFCAPAIRTAGTSPSARWRWRSSSSPDG